MSAFYNVLDKQWLWKEVYTKLGISAPAYKYWRGTPSLKLNRYLFLQKESLPQKYSYIEDDLTDLSGFLPTTYASQQLNMDSHIFNFKKMRLYNRFEYKFVNDIKFVNIKRFFLEHNIKVHKESIVRIGRLDELPILPNSTFYRIDDSHGVVVYD
jgi:hypothetical protein